VTRRGSVNHHRRQRGRAGPPAGRTRRAGRPPLRPDLRRVRLHPDDLPARVARDKGRGPASLPWRRRKT